MRYIPTHQDLKTGIQVQRVTSFIFDGHEYAVIRANEFGRLENIHLTEFKENWRPLDDRTVDNWISGGRSGDIHSVCLPQF